MKQSGRYRCAVAALSIAAFLVASPVQAAETLKITITEPIRVITFAPLYVAIERGYFKDENIAVDLVSGGGGVQAAAAIISGEAQFSATGSNEMLQLVSKGQDIVGVSGINMSLMMQTIVSRDFAKKKGITQKSPVKERIAALKGATMGGISLGGAHEIFLRYNMVLGGLNSKDVNVVRVGGGMAMIAALEKGTIDGFIIGPPTGREVEERGTGYIWVDPTELPQYRDMVWQVLMAKGDYVKKNPRITQAVVRALARGINFTMNRPDDVAPLMKPYFKGMTDKAIETGIKEVGYTFRRDGRMTRDTWENAIRPLQELKMVGALDARENGFWTNEYIVSVPAN